MNFEMLQGAVGGGVGTLAMAWVFINYLKGDIKTKDDTIHEKDDLNIDQAKKLAELTERLIEALTLNNHLLSQLTSKDNE